MNGKTNTQVAARFMQLFDVSGTKTDAQVMAGVFAIYITNSTLSGSTGASKFGFNVSTSGTGAKYYNVGSAGSAIGLTNGASYTVLQLMQRANALAPYNSTVFNALNVIFDGINQKGDII